MYHIPRPCFQLIIMALLAFCWLLTETFIIPHGFLKWFYLSFYIHPLFLFFCQISLWLNILYKWLLFLFSPLMTFLNNVFILLFSFKSTPIKVDVFDDALEPENLQIIPTQDCEDVNKSRLLTGVVFEKEKSYDTCIQDSWLNEYLYSDHYNGSISVTSIHEFEDSEVSYCDRQLFDEGSVSPVSSFESLSTTDDYCCSLSAVDDMLVDHESFPARFGSNSLDETLTVSHQGSVSSVSDCCSLSAADDMHVDHEYDLQPFCGSNSPVINIQQDIDPFHQKYTSRMRFFNLLHHERLHGINAVSNTHLSIPGFSAARRRLLRSLESDIEMIYVAQCCLLWEALHHQYHKVEALTFYENVVFHPSVSGKYQQLQILLERYVEDQQCERLSFQFLLQVPDATGYIDIEGEGIKASQVSDAINNCITAFWLYIKTDNKKSYWKYNGIRTTHHPPVEDPQDLELLYNVTKTLHKKGRMMKDLQGKWKCWVRRVKVKGVEAEDEKRNLVFAMIDMKLVQRLLKMSLVSQSQLKWCQHKLNNLDFKHGKVFRTPSTHLFPSS